MKEAMRSPMTTALLGLLRCVVGGGELVELVAPCFCFWLSRHGPGVPEEVDGQAEVDGGEEDQVRHQEEPVCVLLFMRAYGVMNGARVVSSMGWQHYPYVLVASSRQSQLSIPCTHAPEDVAALVQPRLDPAGGRASDKHGEGFEHEEAGGGGGPDGVAPDAVHLLSVLGLVGEEGLVFVVCVDGRAGLPFLCFSKTHPPTHPYTTHTQTRDRIVCLPGGGGGASGGST